MTPEELRQRINTGEDSRTEFKDEQADADSLAAAIISFANSAGGLLLVGVSDRGAPVGVADQD